jgi:hypothetical protein
VESSLDDEALKIERFHSPSSGVKTAGVWMVPEIQACFPPNALYFIVT